MDDQGALTPVFGWLVKIIATTGCCAVSYCFSNGIAPARHPDLLLACASLDANVYAITCTLMPWPLQDPAVQQRLLELNAVGRCMDYVREKACVGREDLLVMLLANLTALEAGAEELLQVWMGWVRIRYSLHVYPTTSAHAEGRVS